MKKSNHLAIALLVSASACQPAPEPPVANVPTESDTPSNRIDIPATVRRNLGITFATVESRRVADTIRVPGAFELRSRARHEYRMALPGRVELLVDQYETVEADQLLFRFQSPAWPELLHEIIVGEQAIDTALAEIEVAEARSGEARRKLELAQERIEALAQADFKRADLEAEAAELEASLPRLAAERKLSEARLSNARRTREHALHRAATAAALPETQLEREVRVGGKLVPTYQTIDWIEVRAAAAGVVELLAVTDGAFVEPPATVLSTVDPAQVRFRALALQGDLPRLADAAGAHIVPPRSPGIPIEDSVPATMTFGLEAHPQERTMTLLATPLELAPWIHPGVSGFLEIVVDSSPRALAVPRSAIVQDGLTHVFFRRDPSDPSTAIRVEADMGVSDGRWVVLNSGVGPGDEVVLAGAYELKLATTQNRSGSQGGHVHADGSTHTEH
jgi:multidrug efflux pump subunit AcrA (membrane-fusion protein)